MITDLPDSLLTVIYVCIGLCSFSIFIGLAKEIVMIIILNRIKT